MKKLKFLTLAAIAAATAMVSSCSDNVDLSTPTKEAEGKALVVNPTVDGSRIVTTTSGDFTSFKLFGFQNPPSTQPLFFNGTDGYVYNGAIGSAWSPTATGAKWPANSDTNSSNFYALSVNGGSSLPSYTGVDLADIQQGKFSYTAPTTAGGDVDLSKQEDILVASRLNALQTDNNGVLNLPFTHALAKLTMQMRFNSYENDKTTGDIMDNYVYTIKSITIHNVKLNGQYSFSSGWTPSDVGDVTINFSPAISINSKHLTGDAEYQDIIDNAHSIMIVPQTTSSSAWVSTNENKHTLAEAEAEGTSYIEVLGWIWDKAETKNALMGDFSWTDNEAETFLNTYPLGSLDISKANTDVVYNGQTGKNIGRSYQFLVDDNRDACPVYFPFPASFSFEENKYYNIRLNIYKGLYDTGVYAIFGAGQV